MHENFPGFGAIKWGARDAMNIEANQLFQWRASLWSTKAMIGDYIGDSLDKKCVLLIKNPPK